MTASLYSHFNCNSYNASNYRIGSSLSVRQKLSIRFEVFSPFLLFGLRKTKSNLGYNHVSPDLKSRTYQIQVNNFKFQFSYVKCFRKVLGIKRFFFRKPDWVINHGECRALCECRTITSALYQVPLQSLSSLR